MFLSAGCLSFCRCRALELVVKYDKLVEFWKSGEAQGASGHFLTERGIEERIERILDDGGVPNAE